MSFRKSYKQDFEAIIFDLDGTLIDILGLFLERVEEVWQEVGLPLPDRNKVVEILAGGRRFWDDWEKLVPPDLENPEEAKKQCMEIDEQFWVKGDYVARVKLIPGAKGVLTALKEAKIPLGIASSTKWEGYGLKAFRDEGIEPEDFFDTVVTALDIPQIKPAPDSILECAKRLGISPSESICVGDAPVDVIAGKKAGTITIAVLSGAGSHEALSRENPDAIIQSVANLFEIVKIRRTPRGRFAYFRT